MKGIFLYAVSVFICLSLCGCDVQSATNPVKPPNLQMQDPFDPDRPPTAKTLYVMADILVGQGNDPQARVVLERITREYPDYFPAYNSLAELHMRHRRVSEAIQTLNAGLRVNANDPVLLNNLGMCQLVMKDYEMALDSFTRAAGQSPENTRYRSNMATALLLMGRRQEALALYEQILPREEALENIDILCNTVKQEDD